MKNKQYLSLTIRDLNVGDRFRFPSDPEDTIRYVSHIYDKTAFTPRIGKNDFFTESTYKLDAFVIRIAHFDEYDVDKFIQQLIRKDIEPIRFPGIDAFCDANTEVLVFLFSEHRFTEEMIKTDPSIKVKFIEAYNLHLPKVLKERQFKNLAIKTLDELGKAFRAFTFLLEEGNEQQFDHGVKLSNYLHHKSPFAVEPLDVQFLPWVEETIKNLK